MNSWVPLQSRGGAVRHSISPAREITHAITGRIANAEPRLNRLGAQPQSPPRCTAQGGSAQRDIQQRKYPRGSVSLVV